MLKHLYQTEPPSSKTLVSKTHSSHKLPPTSSMSSWLSRACGALNILVVVLCSFGALLGCACANSLSLSSVSPSPSIMPLVRRLWWHLFVSTLLLSPQRGVPSLGSLLVKSSLWMFVQRRCHSPLLRIGYGTSVSAMPLHTLWTPAQETQVSNRRCSSFGDRPALAVWSSHISAFLRWVYLPVILAVHSNINDIFRPKDFPLNKSISYTRTQHPSPPFAIVANYLPTTFTFQKLNPLGKRERQWRRCKSRVRTPGNYESTHLSWFLRNITFCNNVLYCWCMSSRPLLGP